MSKMWHVLGTSENVEMRLKLHNMIISVLYKITNILPFSNWWPFFVIVFYFLAPIPMILAKRYTDSNEGNAMDCALFFTMGIVISAFGLPIILARSPIAAPTVSFPGFNCTLNVRICIID